MKTGTVYEDIKTKLKQDEYYHPWGLWCEQKPKDAQFGITTLEATSPNTNKSMQFGKCSILGYPQLLNGCIHALSDSLQNAFLPHSFVSSKAKPNRPYIPCCTTCGVMAYFPAPAAGLVETVLPAVVAPPTDTRVGEAVVVV